jgi:uncharacterized protein DUF4331
MNQSMYRLTSVVGAFSLLCGQMFASSHSDAPLSKQDPQTNLTDVYGFITPGTHGNALTIVVNCRPFSEPGDGVMYERFADDALYSIHITNPATGALLRSYNFRFSPVSSAAGNYKDKNTILSYGNGPDGAGAILTNGDVHQNFTQTYSVTVTNADGFTTSELGSKFLAPPPNTGSNITPFYNGLSAPANAGAAAQNPTAFAVSGATSAATLDSYTKQAVFTTSTGELVFAGSREDSFFADAPGIFDLLDARIVANSTPPMFGQAGGGVDGFKGYNVLTFAIQIPLANLPAAMPYTNLFTNKFPAATTGHGLGIYASVSRQQITLRDSFTDNINTGPWIQVNRLGNPLFNEVLVAIQDKDNYNRDVPTNDAARYQKYAEAPEIAALINAVFGFTLTTTGRADLVAVYIPDVLRVDTTTGPVDLIGLNAGANRLSGLGGDVTPTSTPGISAWSGWPNGRRLADDVVDIALTAVASGPTFSSVIVLGDNVNMNDQFYNLVFPYAATPNAGTRNSKDNTATFSTTN